MKKAMQKVVSGNQGFTLVELIIVIIILGILAALAIPQFTTSTQDAKESTLKADLAVLRNAVNLYFHEHSSTYPGAVKEDGTGTATGAGDNPDAFVNQMTQFTDKSGKVSATKDALFPYGPYLTTMPDNPLAHANVAAAALATTSVTSDLGAITADGTPTVGWKYSKETGWIICNNATYAGW
jgi:prepilin-type N-terminal cleavage/methylation domain-containing protein